MYQFSLQSFITLFRASLSETMEHKGVEDRISKLRTILQTRVLYFVGQDPTTAHFFAAPCRSSRLWIPSLAFTNAFV